MDCGSLHTHTLNLLRNRPVHVTLKKLAAQLEEHGVTHSWLGSFITGRISVVSVDKIQAIYELLSGKKLDL